MVVLEAEMTEAFGDGLKARCLRLVVQRVIGIGTVDDPPENVSPVSGRNPSLFPSSRAASRDLSG
jgi:hypothetical protein